MGNCAPVNEKMLKNTPPYTRSEYTDTKPKSEKKTKGIVVFEDEESKDDPETQLLTASKDGNYEIVSELLRKNVNVDVKNCDGDTPLILASYYNHVNIVEEIFKYYPNIEAKNNKGMTAEKIASSKKHQQIVQMIFRNYQTTDSQFSKYNFNTSLMLASFNGHTNVVSELLQRGANIKAKNIDGMTAYDFAVLKNHRNVATLLQNINKQDNTSIHKIESVPKKNLIERTTCPVCMINERKIIFGCGHSVCFKCSNSLDKCLICVTKITDRTQCYF